MQICGEADACPLLHICRRSGSKIARHTLTPVCVSNSRLTRPLSSVTKRSPLLLLPTVPRCCGSKALTQELSPLSPLLPVPGCR